MPPFLVLAPSFLLTDRTHHHPIGCAQVERVLRLDENVLRFFTLRPKTQADLIRVRKGFRAGVWADPTKHDPEAIVAKQRAERARLFHEEE